jgi:hypothetical protein
MPSRVSLGSASSNMLLACRARAVVVQDVSIRESASSQVSWERLSGMQKWSRSASSRRLRSPASGA